MASSSSKRRNYFHSSRRRMLLDDGHENLLHRSIPKHNLVCWLRDRELGYRKPRLNHAIARRTSVYRAIHPSYSVLMCTVPQAVYIRRFSPNGQYLLAFSHDLESLIVYRYKGKHVFSYCFVMTDSEVRRGNGRDVIDSYRITRLDRKCSFLIFLKSM